MIEFSIHAVGRLGDRIMRKKADRQDYAEKAHQIDLKGIPFVRLVEAIIPILPI